MNRANQLKGAAEAIVRETETLAHETMSAAVQVEETAVKVIAAATVLGPLGAPLVAGATAIENGAAAVAVVGRGVEAVATLALHADSTGGGPSTTVSATATTTAAAPVSIPLALAPTTATAPTLKEPIRLAEDRPRAVFAFDVESSGANIIKHEMIALGWCAYEFSPGAQAMRGARLLAKGRVSFRLHRPFEPRCWETFWSQHSKVLDELRAEARDDPRDALSVMTTIFDTLCVSHRVTLVSDCQTHDSGFLNYYLAKYLGRHPLSYAMDPETKRPVYIGCSGPEEFALEMAPRTPQTASLVFTRAAFEAERVAWLAPFPHDHRPDNDAQHTALAALLLLEHFSR